MHYIQRPYIQMCKKANVGAPGHLPTTTCVVHLLLLNCMYAPLHLSSAHALAPTRLHTCEPLVRDMIAYVASPT